MAESKNPDYSKAVEDGVAAGINGVINGFSKALSEQIKPIKKTFAKEHHLNECQQEETENCKKNYIQKTK
jgi:hypothetical protein